MGPNLFPTYIETVINKNLESALANINLLPDDIKTSFINPDDDKNLQDTMAEAAKFKRFSVLMAGLTHIDTQLEINFHNNVTDISYVCILPTISRLIKSAMHIVISQAWLQIQSIIYRHVDDTALAVCLIHINNKLENAEQREYSTPFRYAQQNLKSMAACKKKIYAETLTNQDLEDINIAINILEYLV